MFRFTIRDVLWMTALVAVTLALWLGWSREVAKLKEENAARETKLRHDNARSVKMWWKDYSKLLVKAKKQEEELKNLKSSDQ